MTASLLLHSRPAWDICFASHLVVLVNGAVVQPTQAPIILAPTWDKDILAAAVAAAHNSNASATVQVAEVVVV